MDLAGKPPSLKDHVKKHWFKGVFASSAGAWYWIDPSAAKELFGEAMQHEITKMTIAFIIAWKIVKRDMKKDMSEEFSGLRLEIAKLGEGFAKVGEDLKSHSSRLDKLDEIVSQLKSLYEKLIGGLK